MQRIAHFILIEAPVERVFAFVADYRNVPRMQTQFKSVRLLSAQERGLGARIEALGSFRGMPLTAQMIIVGFEEPRVLVSDSTGGVRSRTTWRFDPQAGAGPDTPPRTRAAVVIEYEITIPGLSLLSGLVHRDVDNMTMDSLRRLKVFVEASAEC
jgi:uncharacterized membrane protein